MMIGYERFTMEHFPLCQIMILTTSFFCSRQYWVIQNDCGQVWQLCTKIYVATVWVG
jgi:hypothetical protein